jgi:hypothetical protein
VPPCCLGRDSSLFTGKDVGTTGSRPALLCAAPGIHRLTLRSSEDSRFRTPRSGLVAATQRPGRVHRDRPLHEKKKRLMSAINLLNRFWGPDTVFFGAQGLDERGWQMKQARISPHYTTRWREVLVVHAR